MNEKAKPTLMGVCSTIANKYNFDVFIVRVLVLMIILTTGVGLLVYFLLGLFASEDTVY
jgi:phage shock protein PspC (stress-responsive transcriptional regulator)